MPDDFKFSELIILHVASCYKITTLQLKEGSLWWPDVEARYVCFFLMNEFLFTEVNQNRRLKLIAQIFNLNRNTVRYGINKINKEWFPGDKRFQKSFNQIKMFVESKILSYEGINN